MKILEKVRDRKAHEGKAGSKEIRGRGAIWRGNACLRMDVAGQLRDKSGRGNFKLTGNHPN